jgi:hypothetical protein
MDGEGHKKIISCNYIIELKYTSKFVYKVIGKWENEVTESLKGLCEVRYEELYIDIY